MKKLSVTLASLLVITCGVGFAQIIAIPDDYASIQAGIEAAKTGDTVLVSEGTYFENINFLGKAITVASNFIIDADTSHISKTIIDGSQSTNPDTASVVTFWSAEDTTSVLTGFTITGGKGTFTDGDDNHPVEDIKLGAGIFLWKAGAKISHNIIKDNHLEYISNEPENVHFDSIAYGGGIGALVGSNHNLIIKSNIIKGNIISSGNIGTGAGIMVNGGISNFIDVNRNIISDNLITTTYGMAVGGGVAYWNAYTEDWVPEIVIRNNIITNNSANGNPNSILHQYAAGGGIFVNGYDNPAEITLYNNIISSNFCNFQGGGIGIELGEVIMINNTISSNNATVGGNSAWLRFAPPLGWSDRRCSLTLINNILWSENTSTSEISSDIGNSLYANYNLIRGGWDGEMNYNLDPLLNESTYELTAISPCIDAGIEEVEINGLTHYAPSEDLKGSIRPNPNGFQVDLGAIESPYKGLISNADELLSKRKIQLYPNPADKHIRLFLDKTGQYQVSIKSVSGKTLKTISFYGNQRVIDLDGLAQGIYYFLITSEELRTSQKILKK